MIKTNEQTENEKVAECWCEKVWWDKPSAGVQVGQSVWGVALRLWLSAHSNQAKEKQQKHRQINTY